MNQSTSGTRDGFQLTRDYFTVPDTSNFDPKTKRSVAICHLFINRQMTVADIVWLLDEENGTVVRALLEQGVIQERRRQPRPAPRENEPRKKSLAGLRTTEIYTRLRT
jgi:hypothetical protein